MRSTPRYAPKSKPRGSHHRFTQIHPFQDGNGRVARALTAAVFLRADCLVLVVRDEEHKERYLDALEAADRGDLRSLVDLFADIQIRDLNEAIRAVRELRGESMVRVSETIAERAKRRRARSQERAERVMERLLAMARTRFEEAGGELARAFSNEGVHLEARVLSDEPDKRDWWTWQIVEAAKEQAYYADLNRSRRWVSLSLKIPEFEERVTRFVISLHAVRPSRRPSRRRRLSHLAVGEWWGNLTPEAGIVTS